MHVRSRGARKVRGKDPETRVGCVRGDILSSGRVDRSSVRTWFLTNRSSSFVNLSLPKTLSFPGETSGSSSPKTPFLVLGDQGQVFLYPRTNYSFKPQTDSSISSNPTGGNMGSSPRNNRSSSDPVPRTPPSSYSQKTYSSNSNRPRSRVVTEGRDSSSFFSFSPEANPGDP